MEATCKQTVRAAKIQNVYGSILTTFVVFLLGMIALGALSLDYRMAVAKRHAVDHLADMMALSAMDGFHTDEVFMNKIAQLSPEDQVIARTVNGMRNAQNVFLAATNSLINISEFKNTFPSSVNWRSEYQELLSWLDNEDSDYTFPERAYSSGNVKFLDEDFDVIKSIVRIDNPLKVKAVKVELKMTRFAHVEPIFIQFFHKEPLRVGATSTAEVVNASLTRSVVLAIDRSISMAFSTGKGQPGGSPPWRYQHLIQVSDFEIQPIQSVLHAAQVLPDGLADLNRFRDSSLNNSFGIVVFDIIAEAVKFKIRSGDAANPYLSHDEDDTRYQEVKDVLTAPLKSQKVPRLVPAEDFDEADWPLCDENHSSTSDPCAHDFFKQIITFQQHWLNKRNSTGPTPDDLWALRPLKDGSALGSFFPWTNTDGSAGLEVAIEILRQERHRFVTREENPPESFQAEIVFLSDTVMNTFHDSNILQEGADPFPVLPTVSFGNIQCDIEGFLGPNAPPSARIVVPASWRKQVTQPRSYGDLYHSGAIRWTKDNFDPDNPPQGFEPLGVETNVNDSLEKMVEFAKPCAASNGSEQGCCPGPDCRGIVSRDLRNASTTTIASDVTFSCSDAALMDYARWAEANKIRIHALGFELRLQGSTSQKRGEFLLDFLSDPSDDGIDVGLVFKNVECNAQTGRCPELEETFKKIGKLLEVRLTSNKKR
ncbi:MAG: Tad domain-containing protein [Candidatus Omnitrophica bacterium]|nr:Tad domain-containing protein [Candidatus Omnitrophota bacterium]